MARKKNYLSNTYFLEELAKYNETKVISDKLANMFILLCKRIGSDRRFNGYSFNDEMQALSIVTLVAKVGKFDVKKGNNPFAYFSQVVFNCFRQYLNAEKKQRDIRDALLVQAELNPSYSYQDNSKNHLNGE